MARRPTLAYAGIGLVAGVFSALFGVGGGLVVVPLLIALCALAPRVATGTSLAAIGLTAVFGAAAYGVLGDVDWGKAATVGLPAVAGVLAGVWLQQRIGQRLLVFLFAGFLVLIAVQLLVR